MTRSPPIGWSPRSRREVSALALDRQAIEKKDFPISRRGYEPEAVDLHLETLAGEVERLQTELDRAQRAAATAGAPPPPPAPTVAPAVGVQSLALVASEQVRTIVEAAETSAAGIERSAQEEAARIRSDADTEARRARDEAVARSQDHVGNVSEATSTMLQRVDAMENELEALVESLRTGTNRLTADLSLLQGNLGDLYGAAGSTKAPAPPRPHTPAPVDVPPEMPVVVPEPVTPEAIEPEELEPLEPEPDLQPELALESEELLAPEPELVDDEPVVVVPAESVAAPEKPDPEPQLETAPEPESEPTPPAAAEAAPPVRRQSEGDVEGARLIALNMALNGQSREETDTYLRDNFDLDDRVALLDEVYATVEG